MNTRLKTACIKTDDGTGDLIFDIPEGLQVDVNWGEGNILNFEILADQTILPTKLQLTDAERNQPLTGQERESFD